MTEQAQSIQADDRAGQEALAADAAGAADGPASGGSGGATGDAAAQASAKPEPASGGREVLDAIDHLMNAGSGTPAREALDAISLRLGDAYAALGPAGDGVGGPAEIPEAAVREAAEREKARQDAEARAAVTAAEAQARTAACQTALLTASDRLGRTLGAVANISALLTWQPDRAADTDRLVANAAFYLSDFRAHLAAYVEARQAVGGGPDRDPDDDLAERYNGALAAMRELHRQVGAHIAVLETDASNTPALLAMERVVAEQAVRVNVMCQGLGLSLAEAGMTR